MVSRNTKLLGECLGRARQNAGSHTHGGDRRAELDASLRKGGIARQYPGGLVARSNPPNRVLDGAFHVGMGEFADMTQTRSEIARTNENTVHAVDGCNRFEVVQ